jgi:hypothetical protein
MWGEPVAKLGGQIPFCEKKRFKQQGKEKKLYGGISRIRVEIWRFY